MTRRRGIGRKLAASFDRPVGGDSYDRGMAGRDVDDLPTGDTKVKAVQSMFDTIAPRYDLVNRVMTFRMDVGWRRRALRAGPPPWLGCARPGVRYR